MITTIIIFVIGLVLGYYIGFLIVKVKLVKLLRKQLIDLLHNGEIEEKGKDSAYKILKEMCDY